MFIISSKPGQLGNRLIVAAHFIALSIDRGVTIANLSLDEYADWFEPLRQDAFCRYPVQRSFLKPNKKIRRLLYQSTYYAARALSRLRLNGRWIRVICLDWDEHLALDSAKFLRSIQPQQVTLVQGWSFPHASAFTEHGDKIREAFRPVEAFEKIIASVIKKARQNCDVLVGVHIRQGDYRTFLGGKYFFETEEYIEIMKRIQRLFPDTRVGFLVCSNVEQKPSLFSALPVTNGPDHPLMDMYALAKCDYIIGPPSTYTIWASFYGKAPLYMINTASQAPTLEQFQWYTGNTSSGEGSAEDVA